MQVAEMAADDKRQSYGTRKKFVYVDLYHVDKEEWEAVTGRTIVFFSWVGELYMYTTGNLLDIFWLEKCRDCALFLEASPVADPNICKGQEFYLRTQLARFQSINIHCYVITTT